MLYPWRNSSVLNFCLQKPPFLWPGPTLPSHTPNPPPPPRPSPAYGLAFALLSKPPTFTSYKPVLPLYTINNTASHCPPPPPHHPSHTTTTTPQQCLLSFNLIVTIFCDVVQMYRYSRSLRNRTVLPCWPLSPCCGAQKPSHCTLPPPSSHS